MGLLVLKFGGVCLTDVERIKSAAGKVAAEAKLGHKIVVVVSAMKGVTDQLTSMCRSVAPVHDPREHDVVIATGEQMVSGLMAMALQQRGLNAHSWQGWQLPIRTNATFNKAKIKKIDVSSLMPRLASEIAVVSSFAGVTEDGSLTTLGTGGSDALAVALAAELKADRCDIYTDTEGLYTANPQIVTKAVKLSHVSYEEMLELASLGARVLRVRAVEMAMRYKVPLQVLSISSNAIGSDRPGTLVCDEVIAMEQKNVTGIALAPNVAYVTIRKVPDKPGVAAHIFKSIASTGINVDMIVQAASAEGTKNDITFTIPRNDLARTQQILESEKEKIGYKELLTGSDVVKISVVGIGMRSNSGIASTLFETMAAKHINIRAIETSEISISILVDEEYAELALRSLHSAFNLETK